ncbi:hypothetical protein LTR08_004560 [Meristemomyces frigidus]|nr:hypothetical protein LTR08_004560 [Meristemomyces frigidus]
MVSFWPFKGDDRSAASFEKVLSQLSTKINKASAQNDGFRQRQRRYKVLWTLYSAFAYILVAAILTLVTGYQSWSTVEYSAIAGSPLFIFGIRTALDAYYNYRISNSQTHLNELYKQREVAIQKLKAATKYDSTQQLLEKYGGNEGKRGSSPQPSKKRKSEGGQGGRAVPPGARTGMPPPPTANIQRPNSSGPVPPQDASRPGSRASLGFGPEAAAVMRSQGEPSEEFAPNAFSPSSVRPQPIRQQSIHYAEGPKWYDRILDVVLGEDETHARNRMALICQKCRLVNGQAPPSARTPEDVGRWRCSSCHAWNGVESEEKRILQQMGGAPRSSLGGADGSAPQAVGSEDDVEVYEHVEEEDGEADDGAEHSTAKSKDASPSGSTRSKGRPRKKA